MVTTDPKPRLLRRPSGSSRCLLKCRCHDPHDSQELMELLPVVFPVESLGGAHGRGVGVPESGCGRKRVHVQGGRGAPRLDIVLGVGRGSTGRGIVVIAEKGAAGTGRAVDALGGTGAVDCVAAVDPGVTRTGAGPCNRQSPRCSATYIHCNRHRPTIPGPRGWGAETCSAAHRCQ